MDASSAVKEVEPKDIEFFEFTSLVADAKVSLQESPFNTTDYPASVSLLAISNKQGKFAAATTEGFVLASTKDLRDTFYAASKGATVPFTANKVTVPVAEPIRQVRFSADETQIFVATSGRTLLLYNVAEVESSKSDTKPAKTFSFDDEILDVRPNPEVYPNMVAVLLDSKKSEILDKDTGSTVCKLPVEDATAICWSPRGKQIVCGKTDGALQFYDIQANCKDVVPIPDTMKADQTDESENRFVQDILWIENNIFLVIYARRRQEQEDDFVHDAFLINRKPKNGTGIEYSCLPEVSPAFTTDGRGYHFYMEIIRGLGKEIEHLVIVANAASSEVSVVGNGGLDEKDWATWMLSEAGSLTLPLSNVTSLDTFPVGAALDFTADEELPPIDASTEKKAQAVPIFYYLNDEGLLRGFHCHNIELARRGESYKTAVTTNATTPNAPTTVSAAPMSNTAATSAAPASAFASAFANSTPSSAFSDLLSGKGSSPVSSTPESNVKPFSSFASLGTSTPSFSSLGAGAKPMPKPNTAVFGASSGFGGATTAAKPVAFGSSSTFGTNSPAKTDINTSTSPTAFGQTFSFGVKQPAASGADTAKNASAFGKPSFFGAASAANTTSSTTTAFPAFGKPSFFGASPAAGNDNDKTNKPAVSNTAFGKPSLFGATPATKTSVSTATDKPAADNTSDTATTDLDKLSLSGTSQPVASNADTANKASAFGKPSLFGGASASSSAAETADKPAADATGSAAPAFGSAPAPASSNTTDTASKLAATSEASAPATNTPSFASLGASAKPMPKPNTAVFGASSGFGGATTATKPMAFGSPSTFGTKSAATTDNNTTASPTAFGQPSSLGVNQPTTSGADTANKASAFGKPSLFGTTSDANTTSSTLAFGKPSLFGAASASSNATETADKPVADTTSSEAPAFGSAPASSITTDTASKPAATSEATSPATTTTASIASTADAGAKTENKSTETAPTPPTVYPSKDTSSASATKASATASTEETAATTSKTETFTPTAKDGMAKEYENMYMTVKAETDKLKEYSRNLNKIMKIHTEVLEARSKASLSDEELSWNLNDISNLNNITKELINDTVNDEKQVTETQASVKALIEGLKKLLEKKEEIDYLLQSTANEKIIDIMDNRDLDAETKSALVTLQSKAEAYDDMLLKLEWRLLEHEKREKIRNKHSEGQITLYSFHRAIRDIELDTRRKKKDLDELEEKLALMSLNESRRRAKQASVGYSCEDLTDSEPEDTTDDEPAVSAHTIKQTTMYIRRYNFMDKVCNALSNQTPLQVSIN